MRRSSNTCKCRKGYSFSGGLCSPVDAEHTEDGDKDKVEQGHITDDSCHEDGDCGGNAHCEVKSQESQEETSLQAAIDELSKLHFPKFLYSFFQIFRLLLWHQYKLSKWGLYSFMQWGK